VKRSKPSKSILIAVMTLSTIFVASVTAFSQTGRPTPPLGGITITINRRPPKGAARTTQTDAEGNFTVSDLVPGLYDIRLACGKCKSMDIGEVSVQLTLTGTAEGEFKRTISKRELVSGVVFPIEIAEGSEKRVRGHVSLIK
jgi:hypothetical protein